MEQLLSLNRDRLGLVPSNPLHRIPRQGSHSPLKYNTPKLGRNHTAMRSAIIQSTQYLDNEISVVTASGTSPWLTATALQQAAGTRGTLVHHKPARLQPNLPLTLSPSAGSREDFPSHMVNQGIFIPKKESHSSPPGKSLQFFSSLLFRGENNFCCQLCLPSHPHQESLWCLGQASN